MFKFPHADDERASHHAKSVIAAIRPIWLGRSDAISNSLGQRKVKRTKNAKEKCNAQDAEQSTIVRTNAKPALSSATVKIRSWVQQRR